MISRGELTGAVLAGGYSRRMGRDKSLLEIDHQPLWARQAALLQAAGCATVGIVRRTDQAPLDLPRDIPLWHDTVAGIGPLAGLHAALLACPTNFLAVVAVDLPRLDAGWYAWLAEFCADNRGAVARRSGGIFEPLAAIYPKSALAGVRARLPGPDLSLQTMVTTMVARQDLAEVALPESENWRVENWNTPADAAASAAGPASAGS